MTEIIIAGSIGFIFLAILGIAFFFMQAMHSVDPFSVRKKMELGKLAQMNLSVKLMQTQKHLNKRTHELENLTHQINKANQDLMRLNDLKTKFFHVVTHEIRNPLGVISGYSDMLTNERKDGLTDEQLQFLESISKASNRANLLLSDLTDMVAIESGKFKLELLPTDLRDVLTNVMASLEFITSKKSITLDIQTPAQLPLVNADANRFSQVFINLVTNASKFTPEKGVIRIKMEEEKKTANQGGRSMLILVKDNGTGFMPEESRKIFDRFYQAKNQDGRTMQKGFGLGLFIVNEIIKSHQGEIWAESEGLGKGASFWIRLPVPDQYGFKANF